ncbi:activating signal cointegrator 1 complex subunit, ASCC1-like protein [Schizosaccharomyces osmophilus]|uniref:Activating signal cointegrator 1 complex subunit, ASCC1-like protein n=1 Tax=Schizosaccharomyces osmophilus TaxID=2545709 RepID=A0AAF0AUB6_9SCHI|nr:activating signal cointegrator 1 complex subunit, ASCC1-like protein [Schizosaccharomyces osmophilus]WBW70654.1 activating signal cointegrator 1 complex subunit, ASCC1-like protein [Schizosaccharomyces osmophilus]
MFNFRYPNLLFLALPLPEYYLKDSYETFRNFLGDSFLSKGYRGPRVSHLTIGMIPVKSEEDVLRSIDHLKDNAQNIQKAYGNELLKIDLQGTSYFGKSPEEARVLYAVPQEQHGRVCVQRFCEYLRESFEDVGIFSKDNRPLTLHCTLLNSRYMKRGKKRLKHFDANPLLERFVHYPWAQNISLSRLCIMKTGAVGPPGDMYYEEIDSIPLH